MKLTTANVKKLRLPEGKDEMYFSDDLIPNFKVRLRTGAAMSWWFRYGKSSKIALGNVGAVDDATVRKTAGELYHRLRLGHDPAAEIAERKRAANGLTFGHAVETYLKWRTSPKSMRPLRHSSLLDVQRHLLKNLERLHRKNLCDVTQADIAGELTGLATTSPVQANRTRGSVHKFLKWCRGEGLIDINVAEGCNKQPEAAARDRHLSDSEIRELCHALPPNDFGAILKLLLLTGQREAEIAKLRWSEIDFDRSVIELPPARTKNGRRHDVPMSDQVRVILESVERREGSDFVFGRDGTGFSGWSKSKNRLDEVLKIPAWRVHDLRRTCATGTAELGVLPHVIEAVLNHVSGSRAGVAGTYNRSKLETEKRRVLDMWADHVAGLVDDRQPKVVPMRSTS